MQADTEHVPVDEAVADESSVAPPPTPRRWSFDVESLCRELAIGWSEEDQAGLERELAPYTDALAAHLRSGVPIPSHIEGSPALCAPITPFDHPADLFADAAGEVGEETWKATEYDEYWVTLHYSTVPVVMQVLKRPPRALPKLADLCRRAGEALGRKIGGDSGAYLQWIAPGYWWEIHTDDDFEAVDHRIHLPFDTTPECRFVWARTLEAERSDWVLAKHLMAGRVYCARVDVPHTAGNDHPTRGRLHLILDVGAAPAGNGGPARDR